MAKKTIFHLSLKPITGQRPVNGPALMHSSNAHCCVTPRFPRRLLVTDQREYVTCAKCLKASAAEIAPAFQMKMDSLVGGGR